MSGSSSAELVHSLRTMMLIRRFDETALELRLAGRIYGTVHPYVGQEAVAAGVCSVLRPDDKVVSNHRGHGHSIAKGTPVNRMMAELFGRVDGSCKGKGGSMHIADFGVGMLGANGIVGAGLPQAAGAALAFQMEHNDSVVICFFGEGATGEGVFHEALNISALWKLPVVFICENNGYSGSNPTSVGLGETHVSEFARAVRIPAEEVDGNDIQRVMAAAKAAVARARSGSGPTLLECMTYRWLVHNQRGVKVADTRSVSEVEQAKAEDPIARLRSTLMAEGAIAESTLFEMERSIEDELQAAIEFANESPFPSTEDALADVFADAKV